MSTSGVGASNKHATVVISAITETTAQTISISGESLTDGNGEFTVTNSAASSNTLFNITGGANDDTLAGSNGNDTILGGIGADVITGNDGDDSIDLTESADELDTVVFAATAALNGVDNIVGFSQGAGNDILNVAAFDTITGMNATLTAAPGVGSEVTMDATLIKLVDIADNQDITTAAGLTEAVATGGEYATMDMGNSQSAVAITAASNAAGVTQHMFFLTSNGSGVITAAKVATLPNLDIDTFHVDNI